MICSLILLLPGISSNMFICWDTSKKIACTGLPFDGHVQNLKKKTERGGLRDLFSNTALARNGKLHVYLLINGQTLNFGYKLRLLVRILGDTLIHPIPWSWVAMLKIHGNSDPCSRQWSASNQMPLPMKVRFIGILNSGAGTVLEMHHQSLLEWWSQRWYLLTKVIFTRISNSWDFTSNFIVCLRLS